MASAIFQSQVRDASGSVRRIKGHIIATRFATEVNSPRTQSGLFAEDPETPGNQPLGDDEARELGAVVRSLHYSRISSRLAQPVLAAALANGVQDPDELRIPVVIWEMQLPPLRGKRFVGGYFPTGDGVAPVQTSNGRIVFSPADPLGLDSGTGTFFGVERIFVRSLLMHALLNQALGRSAGSKRYSPFYSAFSALRNGRCWDPSSSSPPLSKSRFSQIRHRQ